jgi:acetyl-CoA synthetase
MLDEAADFESLCACFRWRIPARYNIGVDTIDRHPDHDLALIYERADGTSRDYTFGAIKELSNRLANALLGLGVAAGDRIGILLPQAPETAIAHIAAYKMGAIAIPLFTLFGPDALGYRLGDCGARAIVTNAENLDKVMELRPELPELRVIIVTGSQAASPAHAFDNLIAGADADFVPVATAADDPAVIIYTSGTTGNPKGALHAHRVLLGHLPGVEMPQNLFPRAGDLFWTPADWAWIGGLLDVLLPSWHHGVPVLAHRMAKFDPEHAFHLMAKHEVRNAFLPPTALKVMRQVADPQARYAYQLRSIGCGGETLGEELLAWGRETFGLTVNEFYGQTECNLIVSNCAAIMDVRPGSMGRAVPGHAVAIVDDQGKPLPDGENGNIAVRRPDPVMFLHYWNPPEAI